jgi:uncharacterized damage-inducible protein DinB
MSEQKQPEVWLRGPVPGIPALVQPVAHALLQAKEEIRALMHDFPVDQLWQQPAGLASPGFHLQHLTGVLDRLFSYAQGLPLSPDQMAYLKAEGKPAEGITVTGLLDALDNQIERSLQYLQQLDPATLTDPRPVGRQQLPSTVMGLLFHSAEHTMRHTGQLLVTVGIVRRGV